MSRWWGADRAASCREVGRVLQSYLDGEVDQLTARRVARHLEQCRRCGLEAEVYAELKRTLRSRGGSVDDDLVRRLRDFGRRLADEGPDALGRDTAGS